MASILGCSRPETSDDFGYATGTHHIAQIHLSELAASYRIARSYAVYEKLRITGGHLALPTLNIPLAFFLAERSAFATIAHIKAMYRCLLRSLVRRRKEEIWTNMGASQYLMPQDVFVSYTLMNVLTRWTDLCR